MKLNRRIATVVAGVSLALFGGGVVAQSASAAYTPPTSHTIKVQCPWGSKTVKSNTQVTPILAAQFAKYGCTVTVLP